MKKTFLFLGVVSATSLLSQSAFAYDYFKTDGSFKRFSVSAGWLHAMPQGEANAMHNSTAIDSNTRYNNGATSVETIAPAITDPTKKATLESLKGLPGLDPIPAELAGQSQINTLAGWTSPGTGLESDTTDTLGLLFNYHITDNVSLEMKAGVPPTVNILGKGKVSAPVQGTVYPEGLGKMVLGEEAAISTSLPITNMEQGDGVAATARAWLPALEAHYQFGKSGVNKFRPYVGAGFMYAYFDNVEMNQGIKDDLNIAAQRIQLIKNGQAGESLAPIETFKPSNDFKVDVKATSAFAPIATVGATYDFNDRLFAVGSVSYAKLNNESKIKVTNKNGEVLVRSGTKIDIDPVITYLGVGYRF